MWMHKRKPRQEKGVTLGGVGPTPTKEEKESKRGPQYIAIVPVSIGAATVP